MNLTTVRWLIPVFYTAALSGCDARPVVAPMGESVLRTKQWTSDS